MTFENYIINDVIEEIIDYRGKTPKKLGGDWSPIPTKFKALSAKNIKGGRIVQQDTIRYVDDEMYSKWMKQEVNKGTILITSEAPFGELLYWDSDKKIVLSQRLFGLKIKKEFNPRYVYYYMFSNKFQAELSGRATGSTVTGLRQPELLKCNINIPEKEIQDKIANILKSIDRKIDLNNEINNNLQEIALNLFNKEKDSLKVNIGELAKTISKGTTPTKKDMFESRDASTIKYIRVTDFDSYGINMEKLESIPNSIHLSKLKRSILFENDLLVSIAGTLGKVAVVTKKLNNSNTNQAVAFIRLKSKENIGFLYFYLKTESFQEEVRKRQVYAVQPNLSLTELGNIQVPLVDGKEKETFNKLLERILHNNEQNETLAQIRDTLLPKLMNGEIDLDNIEI